MLQATAQIILYIVIVHIYATERERDREGGRQGERERERKREITSLLPTEAPTRAQRAFADSLRRIGAGLSARSSGWRARVLTLQLRLLRGDTAKKLCAKIR
jgi:hypothetical protein